MIQARSLKRGVCTPRAMNQLSQIPKQKSLSEKVSLDLFEFLGTTFQPSWPDRFGEALLGRLTTNSRSPIRTLSLFSGAGGLDIGFHQAGFDIRTSVERDPACVRTLRTNTGSGLMFPRLDVVEGDVAEFHPQTRRRYDLVIGCPPCQSFSAAGRRVEGVIGTNEGRGTLFLAYTRLLKTIRPRAFVFENVAGITGANGGRAWSQILMEFAAAGYRVTYRVLDAADYGVPQHRERMLLVGVRNDLGVTFRFPAPTHGPDSPCGRSFFTANDAIQGANTTSAERLATVGGRYGHLLAEIPPGLNYSYYTSRLGHPAPVFAWRSKFSDFLYKADPAGPVRTLKAEEGGFTGPFHWASRPFAVAEKKRLQTIPDSYLLCGNRGEVQAQIGNAVPCQLARVIALALRSQVFDSDLPFHLPTLNEDDKLGFRTRKRRLTVVYEERAAANHKESSSTNRPKPAFTPRSYRARLGHDFELVEGVGTKADLHLDVGGTANHWQLRVSRSQKSGPAAFTVDLTPCEAMQWPVGLQKAELSGDQLDPQLFIALWRALDAELVRNTGYADLIQLNGYYRNPQRVSCHLTLATRKRDDHWRVLAKVMRREGVGQSLTTRKLSNVWGIPIDRVRSFAEFLRSLGYEVRNRKTNAQIGPGRFLVPYPFPTLTSKSVQRFKRL